MWYLPLFGVGNRDLNKLVPKEIFGHKSPSVEILVFPNQSITC